MPRLLLLEAKWEGEIKFTDKLKKYLEKKKPKSIAVFASIQFTHLNDFIKKLKKQGFKINVTKAKRTDEEIQILGCDCYADSFQEEVIDNSDMILYVGDGLFHPKALLLSQIKKKEVKPIVLLDPISDSVKEIDYSSIEEQVKRQKANLKRFVSANSIGIMVTTKPGQQFFGWAKKLKEKLKKEEKKAYIFIDNTFNIQNLENYPFIEAWVNTACPRIGTDDITTIEQPMINIREAFDPVKALESLENGK